MFVPVFTLNLSQKILPGRLAIGEFDGEHPCLVAATTGERVLVHSPHQKPSGTDSLSMSYFVSVLTNSQVQWLLQAEWKKVDMPIKK